MVMDINSVPGPGGADKNVDSKRQADSEIPKTRSESIKVVQEKFYEISTGLVVLDIRFIIAEFSYQ